MKDLYELKFQIFPGPHELVAAVSDKFDRLQTAKFGPDQEAEARAWLAETMREAADGLTETAQVIQLTQARRSGRPISRVLP